MGLFETFPYVNFQDLNLDNLLLAMRHLLSTMKELESLVGGYNDRIRQLEQYIARLESGNFSAAFLNGIKRLLPDLVGDVIKQVWFGLTDSGYFVAYIPESWKEITFRTTEYDYSTPLQPDYGHLVLLMEVNR